MDCVDRFATMHNLPIHVQTCVDDVALLAVGQDLGMVCSYLGD